MQQSRQLPLCTGPCTGSRKQGAQERTPTDCRHPATAAIVPRCRQASGSERTGESQFQPLWPGAVAIASQVVSKGRLGNPDRLERHPAPKWLAGVVCADTSLPWSDMLLANRQGGIADTAESVGKLMMWRVAHWDSADKVWGLAV